MTLLLLLCSEVFNSEVRVSYESKFGYGSWRSIPLLSLLTGLLSGLLSATGGYLLGGGHLFLYLANFGTVVGYVSMQSMITDPALHKVDRYLLRIAYFDTMVLTVFYLMNNFTGHDLVMRLLSSAALYGAFLFLFITSPIGPSDIRGMLIYMPFMLAVNVEFGTYAFLFVTGLTMVFMTIQKKRKSDPFYAVPILPYLIVPYMVIIPLLPIADAILALNPL